jgi:fructose-bisphosphate aldolase class I
MTQKHEHDESCQHDIIDELESTIDALAVRGKGLLAADESTSTIQKRFDSIGVENTEENRRAYRTLLCTTPNLNESICGVILFEETLGQKDNNGKLLTKVLSDAGIIPGIKVDKGLVDLPNTDGEKVSEGLDGLRERLLGYKKQGARFAKWRNVYNIADTAPTITAIKAGAEMLARYAATCQSVGIVPIVEPEVLMDGDHTIEECAEVTEMVQHEVFNALFTHQVVLEYIILKPNMVIAGANCPEQNTPEEVAEYTLSVLRNRVPAAVPTINFLSGGQSPRDAVLNLNAMNAMGDQPWNVSFSYGRALQDECLKHWAGKAANVGVAQEALLEWARSNSEASLGQYSV